MNKFSTLLTIFLLILYPTCGAESNMKEEIKEILMLPDWTRLEVEELITKRVSIERGQKIVGTLEKYRELAPEKARQFVTLLSSSGEKNDLSIAGKIYIFNRIYFNVPERVEKSNWKYFGGWGSVPDDGKTVEALYPLKVTNDGKLELHYISGSYTGPSYDGIGEFDFLLHKFGKRK